MIVSPTEPWAGDPSFTDDIESHFVVNELVIQTLNHRLLSDDTNVDPLGNQMTFTKDQVFIQPTIDQSIIQRIINEQPTTSNEMGQSITEQGENMSRTIRSISKHGNRVTVSK